MNSYAYVLFLAAFFISLASTNSSAQDKTGLKTSLAADLVGSFAANANSESSNELAPRSVDLLFYAPIDHLFSGLVNLAAHNEDGQAVAAVHEAYISSDKLLPGLKLRLGQFFLGVGRLNRFHQHEWPFITAPAVHTDFFGEEGLFDSGLEASYLLPLPFYLDLTAGVTSGKNLGHQHEDHEEADHEEADHADNTPKTPLHYAHLKGFFSSAGLDIQPGASYLRRVDADGTATVLVGGDVTAKIRNGKILTFLLQSEIWQRTTTPHDTKTERTTGAYGYLQYGFQNGLQIGARYDYLTINSLRDEAGEPIGNSVTAIEPTIGIAVSEFSRLRLAYHSQTTKMSGQKTLKNDTVQIQATYILGAHPSHDF